MPKPRRWWIMERINPQTGTYYRPCGQITAKEAKVKENPTYGGAIMHAYDTEEAYDAEIQRLREAGHRVS